MISVSNIERFATHDGPGIRTTVFLKGCPLHCPWCANPETWSVQPILMHDNRKCVRCRRCQSVCPEQAISFDPDFKLDRNVCTACGKCAQMCLNEALSVSGQSMEISDILKEIEKDKDYYQASSGGVTLSGGEPLLQTEVISLMKTIKEAGYHLAVETTGNISFDRIREVFPYIDLYLFDFKHSDTGRLKEVTGGDLDLILSNLRFLAEQCPEKVIIRVPVIPGFNYSEKVLHSIMKKAKEMGLRQVNLLPYHSLGKNKWHNLQKEYAFEDEKMMDKEVLKPFQEYGQSLGLQVKTGG